MKKFKVSVLFPVVAAVSMFVFYLLFSGQDFTWLHKARWYFIFPCAAFLVWAWYYIVKNTR